ncbi:MAG: argininosuccinate synthase, partial [Desulfuromonadales bacterium]|nr:argininosuccinate synthase [Desulfuromonadales bacterium]
MSKNSTVKKAVLAYSGGLDTSIILKWLIEEYGCEVIAFSADLGQGEELDNVPEKAKNTGASKCYIEDLREEFVRDFVFPMFRANAIYEGRYFLGTSIARPPISKAQMEIAAREGADAVSHGATGKGNDQVRFELAYYHFDPAVTVIAPWREWDLNSRTALEEYARKHDIPVPTSKKFPWSSDRNLLHISFEGDVLEDPWAEAPEEMYVLTDRPEDAPDQPEFVEISFEKGDAVAINGERLSPANLLAKLNELGGKHGIGRVDLMENRFVGM